MAQTAGIEFLGVAGLDVQEEYDRFGRWIDAGKHGAMSYLAENRPCRENPERLLSGAKTVLMLGFNYFQGDKWHPAAHDKTPQIAQYARIRDYHRVLRKAGEGLLGEILERLAAEAALEGKTPENHVGRILVDSAPILERALAARTGGGFIGKNTCFIMPKKGSFFLLAEILTSIPFSTALVGPSQAKERGEGGGCGTCKRCQVHCPTGALDEDYQLDSRKCLSYWTIEHRGTIPERFWPWLRHYYFGCDICQLVCPYNRKAEVMTDVTGLRRLDPAPSLFEVATMNQEFYERVFGGTPMTRAKRDGLRRNALIAMVVTHDPRLEAALGAPDLNGTDMLRETVAQIRKFAGVST